MALLTLACANLSHEPVSTQLSPHDEPSITSGAGQPNGGGPAVSEPTWCEVRAVLENACQRCHGEERTSGAPFSLVTYEDTQVRNKKGTPRYEVMAAALESERMPPTYLQLDPPVVELGADERALLLAWCELGAPGDPGDDCATHD